MTHLRRALLVAGVGGIAAAAGYLANLWRSGGFGPAPQPDVAAAILGSRLHTLDGVVQTLDRFRGQVLIINYWATWCAPCREEIPVFVKLQREFAARGVQFVGIAVDQADKVRDFAKDFRINYPVLIAGMDAVELSRQAGNKAGVLPYTLVLNRSGQIAASLLGGISEAQLREAVVPLL
ncbi:MAG: TlpA family protein disulfide reductase [Betaproteobacteria bacterium]|nr:MAG: TlpA family protein disulfide reductase [Betaproteobacteria bacterium]